MANHYTKWERYFHKLNIIFHGVVAISMIPFAYAFLETQRDFAEPPFIQNSEALILKFILIGISLIIVLVAFNYQKKYSENRKGESLDLRLKDYLSMNIKFYLLIQLAAISACLGLFILKDQFFSFLYVIVLFIFSQNRPTYDRVIARLGINEEEKEELNQFMDS